jgi:hexosaminidase
LLPADIESKKVISNIDWVIPSIEIEDQPRFQWRGLMLDLSRHFFDKEYIKQTIDGLAKHKINILHLHLVDDQGWRIEIKKYPKLTEVGAWRVDQEEAHWNARKPIKSGKKSTYGGFLTQKDLFYVHNKLVEEWKNLAEVLSLIFHPFTIPFLEKDWHIIALQKEV